MSTTTVGAAGGNWPYRRIVLAVLAISVVLNLFFVAGAAWTRIEAPRQPRSIEQRYQRMAIELNLDAQQRAGFERYVAAMRTRGEKMHVQLSPLLATAWEETARTQAEPAHVLRLFDDAFDKRRQFQREAMVQTLGFLATLSPEQRAKFVALARERRGAWRSSPTQSR